MLRCALPVNALSSFIQRAVVERPNKDQINMEEAGRWGGGGSLGHGDAVKSWS